MRDQGNVDAGAVRQPREAAAIADADFEWNRSAADYHDITSSDIARWTETNRRRCAFAGVAPPGMGASSGFAQEARANLSVWRLETRHCRRRRLHRASDGKKYQNIERDVAELASLVDAPVWAIGNYRGLVSRKDALFAIANAITPDDIESFLQIAKLVFLLDDPQFDLPAEERLRANILGKRLEVAGALRQSVGELLVLLALYGNRLIGARLGSIASCIDGLVGKVLKGADARAWLSRQRDLQLLAEAAPDAFLSAVEAGLKSANPQILAMLRPIGTAPFDGRDRTGLLWALELVAWNHDHFGRAFAILGRLSEVAIDDNWMNKPENSLGSPVRFWWPQTAAPLEDRLRKIEAFARTGSNAAWKLLMAQLSNHGMPQRGGMVTRVTTVNN